MKKSSILVLVITLLCAAEGRADSQEKKPSPGKPAGTPGIEAVKRADEFLKTEAVGKDVLSFVHFGAVYQGPSYVRTIAADDDQGRFAWVYRFKWNDDGITDVAFLCNSGGKALAVEVLYTNAFLSAPFALADLVIADLGRALIEAYKDKLSKDDRQKIEELMKNADAKGMLEFSLRTQQISR